MRKFFLNNLERIYSQGSGDDDGDGDDDDDGVDDHNNVIHNVRDEEEAEDGRTKVLAARQREREETRAQVLSSSSTSS